MADGNYALKGAIKGLVAGLRGVTAGKLAVKKAKTERARQEATIALENRRQNFAEAQAFLKHQIELSKEQRETKELDNEETAAKAQEARQKEEQQRLKDLNDDYEEAEKDLTDLENQLDNETDPEKRKTLREQISTKRSRLLRISNRIGNRMTGLEAQQESELDEKTDAAAHTRALELKGEEGKQERLTQKQKTELDAKSVGAISESRPGVAKVETELKAKAKEGVSGKQGLSDPAATFVATRTKEIWASKPYEILRSSQEVVPRMLALYADGTATPADDLALVNMFQRMINPGQSVRTGDIDLQTSTQSMWDQWGLTIKKVAEGQLLAGDLRKHIIDTAVKLANEDYAVLMPKIQKAGNNLLSLHQEVIDKGYDILDFNLQPIQLFEGYVVLDNDTGAVTLSRISPKPETTDFIMRQPNGKAGNVTHSIRELKQPPSDRTYEPYTRENAASKIKEWFPDISDEQLKTELDKVYGAESTETKAPSESDTGETKAEDEKIFQRKRKDTDYLHKDAEGKTYNVHAEVAYMINIDKWTRAQIKRQLKKDYPELEDSKIEEILNDPEFEYPVEN